MGKKGAAASKAARSGAPKAPASKAKSSKVKDAEKIDPYSWEQYSGEGPIFWIRQLAGLFIVVIGTLILASSYSEDHWILPINPEYGAYVSLATIALGALVHEFRPWKVRNMYSKRMQRQQLLNCTHILLHYSGQAVHCSVICGAWRGYAEVDAC